MEEGVWRKERQTILFVCLYKARNIGTELALNKW